MNMSKVCKFGGSSLADAKQYRKIKSIIEADSNRNIVVVSAAGKRSSDDHKITDLLYLCHAHLTYGVPCGEILNTVRDRYCQIRDELGLHCDIEGEFEKLAGKLNKNFSVDELVSRGEYFSGLLMAEYLGYSFLDAAKCVFFTADGQIDTERTYAAIRGAAALGNGLVIPGFYGSLPNGKVKVMSRGGSDISGALAAAAVEASVYENWTDVSGILMADPRIVKNPHPIPQVTYQELRELAFMGASVLHEESIQPVKDAGIPLNIRNTNAPEDPGTMILDQFAENHDADDRFITGIAGRRDFSIVTIHKRNIAAHVDVLRRALKIFDSYKVPIEQITMGLDSFGLICASSAFAESQFDIISDLKRDCKMDGELDITEGISMIAAVGRKMMARPGTSAKLFAALGDNGINIRTIFQSSDEISIMVGVDNKDFEEAIRVLYQEFVG